jgi:predicted molibdopterin-dependent oxidoreductase YjgC
MCATRAALGDRKSAHHLQLLRRRLPAFPACQGQRGGQGDRREGEAPNHGSLCVKGRFGFTSSIQHERLTDPLIKEMGNSEATWDEALDLVAAGWAKCATPMAGDSIGMLTSARITNEENYIAHKFARAVLKTNNIDHCARL